MFLAVKMTTHRHHQENSKKLKENVFLEIFRAPVAIVALRNVNEVIRKKYSLTA